MVSHLDPAPPGLRTQSALPAAMSPDSPVCTCLWSGAKRGPTFSWGRPALTPPRVCAGLLPKGRDPTRTAIYPVDNPIENNRYSKHR